jgi:2-polyprenyl-3-methyl-5-hydroxy-6-metoxy-1,4-benzoquinol methylase
MVEFNSTESKNLARVLLRKCTQSDLDYLFDFDRGADIFRIIQKNVILKKNDMILDVGCGIGTISVFFSKIGFDVTVVEPRRKLIKILKKLAYENNLKLKIFEQDFNNFFIKFKYQLIICNDVLEHIKNKENFIQKMNHALKNNGYVFIKIPNKNSIIQNIHEEHYRKPLFVFSNTLMSFSNFKLFYITKKELILLLSKYGFEVLDLTPEYFMERNSNPVSLRNSLFLRFLLKVWSAFRHNKYLSRILLTQATQIVLLARKTRDVKTIH